MRCKNPDALIVNIFRIAILIVILLMIIQHLNLKDHQSELQRTPSLKCPDRAGSLLMLQRFREWMVLLKIITVFSHFQ